MKRVASLGKLFFIYFDGFNSENDDVIGGLGGLIMRIVQLLASLRRAK